MEKKIQDKEGGKKTKPATEQFDQLAAEAANDRREKKPGSQSNHSKQHNNGRGGGK